jgi:uncharacterized protein (UPF0332 family)
LTKANRRTAVALELRQGAVALRAAAALRQLGMHNDALSRLYYAVFHHACALLLTEGVEARLHASVPSLLGQHFVAAGRLTAGDVASFSRALSFRSLADYERTWVATEEVAAAAFEEAERFIARARELLVAEGWHDGDADVA